MKESPDYLGAGYEPTWVPHPNLANESRDLLRQRFPEVEKITDYEVIFLVRQLVAEEESF